MTKKPNLYILGEESPSHEILTVISWHIKQNLKVDLTKISYNNTVIDNKLLFEVFGASIEDYDKIYYCVVSSCGNSFADYLIFEDYDLPKSDSKPVAALEATKNTGKESGNMSDQRAPKMIPIKEKYGQDIRCAYLINNNKGIDETISSFSHAHNCSFATMNSIGVEIIVSQYGTSMWKTYEVPFKFDCIENLVVAENNKRKSSGLPSRVFQVADNEFEIQVNLYKSYGNNDPGEGYLASRAYILRKLFPTAVIKVINHGRDSKYFNNKNNKLINALKFVGVTAAIKDGEDIVIERNANIFDKPYWKYTNSGEKNASMVLEQIFIQKGLEVMFTNHAGCGKSFAKIGEEYFTTKKTKGIPDIVAFDQVKNTLLIIEGETSKNYSKGIDQVKDPAFDEFIQNEFVSRIGNDVKVKKYICTFGEYGQEPEVLFNLTNNYEMNYNKNAVEVM